MNERPKISAETIEEFEKISKKLQELPDKVVSQIESAEYGFAGLVCGIQFKREEKQTVYLPNCITQITDFGNSIGIYTSDEFFFRICEEMKNNSRLDFVFVKNE
jgi:hypothetical protein